MKKAITLLMSSALILPTILTPTVAFGKSSSAPETLPVDIVENTKITQNSLIKQPDISKEQAIKLAKDAFPIPDNYKQTQVELNSKYYQSSYPAWIIRWELQENEEYGSIGISLNAETGEIASIYFNQSDNNEEKSFPPKVEREEAKEIAINYLEDILPDKVDDFLYDDSNDNNVKPPLDDDINYRFSFNQDVNGIPFKQNHVEISVNGNGNVRNFEYSWIKDYTFPSDENILKAQEVLNKMKDSFPLELQYKEVQSFGSKNKDLIVPEYFNEDTQMQLIYEQVSNINSINAKTGEWLDSQGNPIKDSLNIRKEPISKKPLDSAPSHSKELTAEEAEKIVKSYFSIPKDAELANVEYEENDYRVQGAVWNLRWTKEPSQWVNASVHAQTGELITYNQQNHYAKESNTVKYSEEKAKKIAIDTVKEILPHKANQLSLVNTRTWEYIKNQPAQYYFTFERLHNGIPVPSQRTTVTISSQNGEVIDFDHNWGERDFPSNDNVIPVDEAIQRYFDLHYVELAFELIHPTDEKPKVQLMYTLKRKQTDEPVYLDATKNEWISNKTGLPYEIDLDLNVTDLEGHWADKELRLMVEYRALQPDKMGKIHPDKLITRGEMIKMFMLTQRPYVYYQEKAMRLAVAESESTFNDVSSASPYHVYIEEAVREGLIDTDIKDFKPDEPVTREELALLITRALGYNKLTEYEDLFNLNFEDNENISEKGAVALVQHLGIMTGTDNKFSPQANVSRAQAAKAYFEYLTKQGLKVR
ncbi:YcdB/YcdC domain-containing protein [Bacillus solimangrovi]|uniref:SLH domain-containing protein n=1 Tax=Bacillus solimangrovi TaxID=1305675 RepID=A0A1E5LJQ2_9BACI|nr:YcdB/YcdC domain-containing protein [Bacillus solimangrovi]OEH94323.1 hypothetical protein BFG57_08690 [Bacillus solimangrovi]